MGKAIDVTGQKFGMLTALYPTRKAGRYAWHCRCDCGNECDVESSNLRTGKQQSCGCMRKKSGQDRKKDITGQKFGRLTVIEDTGKRQSGAVVWRCKCDCGNETEVTTGNLQSGHTTSCGCYAKEHTGETLSKDLTGQRFGRLVALERIPGTKDIPTRWKCQCDCGNIAYVSSSCLLRPHGTKSCGCLRSAGEEKILELLRANNIQFEYQKTFDDCRFPNTNSLAIFDFYIDNKYIIEYDGEQHYKVVGWNTEENFKRIKYRDAYKNKWCKEHNIPIIRIPYTRYQELCLKDLILKESTFLCQDVEMQQDKQ